MSFYITGILLISTRVHLVASNATLTLPTSANCGDPAMLTCTSTGCTSGYRFFRDNVPIYNSGGPTTAIPDPDRYSATVTSDSQVQLTITNIQYPDAAQYACGCGFNTITTGQTLVYQCKASTSSASVTSDKKLSITVDRLYPEPSSIVTTNSTTPLQGEQTCWNKSSLPQHFMCSWNSTASFPDGIHNYTITVTTGTQAAPISGSFRIVTPASPSISNLVTISNNSHVVLGVQDTPLTIQCVSKGGIPAPTLAWYRGNTSTPPLAQSSISDSVQMSDDTYTVNLTYRFTPSRTDDLTPLLCRVFYPGAASGASPDPSPAAAILYLNLNPDAPTVSQTDEAVSGKSMTLRCTSSNGRPPPNITWTYKGQTFTPDNTLTFDPTLKTYTAVSVLQRPVSAVDNRQLATCSVSHTTLSVPRNGTVVVDVKFGPKANSTTVSGNQQTPATDNHLLRLNCTSGSSNPASSITWINGSNTLSIAGSYTTWNGENNGNITSNVLIITPTRYMDRNRITCRSDNGYGNDSSYVDLDIHYSPLIQVLHIVTAIEGEPNVTLTCSASSKPPANFIWYKGSIVLASDIGTEADNSLKYMIPRANRTDTGTYRCQASNTVGRPDSKDVSVFVKYPPTVTVSTNTTPPYTITCTAEGFPDNYTYQDWVQIWPGYGPVTTIPFAGTTLTLTNVTYMSSGLYVCNATNGVAVYGTDMRFTQGNATIVISSRPIITDPFSDGNRVPLAGKLGQNVTTEIKYWSNVDGSVVGCYKLERGSRLASSICSVTETVTNVTLPVYKHMVQETGTLATIKIPIINETDLTDYDVIITNRDKAESVLHIYIFPQGPPNAPTLKDNFIIKPGQVILTVLPGFHGGNNQTLVVQISNDLTTWVDKTYVKIPQDHDRVFQNISLDSLQGNTKHYVRVFSYNIDGISPNSEVFSFTTIEDIKSPTDSYSAALIAGIVTGVCTLLVIGVVVTIICWRKKAGRKHSAGKDIGEGSTENSTTDVVECAMYGSAGQSNKDIYAKPQKPKKQTDVTGLYAVVSRPKEESRKAARKSRTKDTTVYENPEPIASSKQAKPKKNFNRDGLIYADLEFNNNPKKTVIHGLNNATTYVQVDFTKAAEPLPDSDDETFEKK